MSTTYRLRRAIQPAREAIHFHPHGSGDFGIMKVERTPETASVRAADFAQPTRKVCIHLVKSALAEDVRTMRAARALVEAGFVVTIVDVEHEGKHALVTNGADFERIRLREEVIHGVHVNQYHHS